MIQKPSRIVGNASRAWCQEKNVSFTRGQPGELPTTTTSSPSVTRVASSETAAGAGVEPAAHRLPLELPRTRGPVSHGSRTSLELGDVDHVREPLLLDLVELAGLLERGQCLVDARDELAPLLESIPNSSWSPEVGWNWPTIVAFGISTAVM